MPRPAREWRCLAGGSAGEQRRPTARAHRNHSLQATVLTTSRGVLDCAQQEQEQHLGSKRSTTAHPQLFSRVHATN